MRIALDAMGGDRAPNDIVRGAIEGAVRHRDVEIILVGDEARIAPLLEESERPENVRVLHASQVVEMDDSPVDAVRRKKDSSLARAVQLVKKEEADAVISAGNTGAMVAASTLFLRTLPGVQKAGIAATLPTLAGYGILLDVGANINARPLHLYHYGVMGVEYARNVIGEQDLSVGLLSIGEEDAKGNELVKETNRIFNESSLNFVGNVEGGDIFKGRAKVVVCEGFVGNVVLKTAEGLTESIVSLFKGLAGGGDAQPAGGSGISQLVGKLAQRMDYATYGCAPLLGVRGVSMIAHGRSSARAIANAITTTRKALATDVIGKITEDLAQSRGE